jgi:hypothetical protein
VPRIREPQPPPSPTSGRMTPELVELSEIRERMEAAQNELDGLRARRNRLIVKARRRKRPRTPTLTEIARACGVGHSYVSMLITDYVGQPKPAPAGEEGGGGE